MEGCSAGRSSDPRLNKPPAAVREPAAASEQPDYQTSLCEAECRIAHLTEQLAASQRRADQAENARDKLEFAYDECASDLKVARDRITSVERESAESMSALQQQYIAALATASEKSNRAREAMDQRDAMRAGIDGLIAEGVAKASELLEMERAAAGAFRAVNEELTRRLEESQADQARMRESMVEAERIVMSMQALIGEANEKVEAAEKEKQMMHALMVETNERVEAEKKFLISETTAKLEQAEKEKMLLKVERDFFESGLLHEAKGGGGEKAEKVVEWSGYSRRPLREYRPDEIRELAQLRETVENYKVRCARFREELDAKKEKEKKERWESNQNNSLLHKDLQQALKRQAMLTLELETLRKEKGSASKENEVIEPVWETSRKTPVMLPVWETSRTTHAYTGVVREGVQGVSGGGGAERGVARTLLELRAIATASAAALATASKWDEDREEEREEESRKRTREQTERESTSSQSSSSTEAPTTSPARRRRFIENPVK